MANLLDSRLTLAHRRNLQALVTSSAKQTRSVVARADMSAIADWWLAGAGADVERIVGQGHQRAVLLTVRYLLAHAAANGAEVDPLPARLDPEIVRGTLFVAGVGAALTALRRTGSPQMAKRVLASGLAGNVQRLVLSGDRETILATFRAGR